jgi:hypothetical protein
MFNSIEDQKQRVLKAREVINYLNTLEPTKNVKIQLIKAAALIIENDQYLNFLENNEIEIKENNKIEDNTDEMETK